QILRQMVQQLSGTEYADLESVWESCFRDNKRELMLTAEELDIVLEVGKNLGYLDAGAQVNHLRACGRRLEQKLDEVQRELEQKQRIYRTLAVAAGAIVILVLL
ncbi:MAG: stage III sporulation protein AB, partial [Lachnospiraceae bacterium]|nr:stage III sporulation protein AB [Lachnospiraceae bacterium]